ncbi:MAG TPA: response regulator [Gemmatimonadaceae bacterium]|nr:response regulator [Gemmatimonadaceae bacterium]
MPVRILVVEDSATQAMALRTVLEEQSFAVTRAASGEDALACLAREPVDVVLSDIMMPGMSGYDLCRHIKTDPELAVLPVVLLTSLGDPLDIVRGLECGADNYVTKPYDPEYLCARLRNVLDRQRLRTSPKASVGVSVSFLGTSFSITSDKEQIVDLFISTVEDVVRTNRALQESQRELAAAQARLEEYARGMTLQAQASTEKYAALMHQASDAIVVLHLDGRILEANARALDLFGVALDALAGRALSEFATTESVARLDLQFARLRDEPRVTAELEFRHHSGRVASCVFSASRTSRREGDLVLAIIHDVTAIRDATDRVRKSEAQLAQAQQLSAVGSWEMDFATGTADWSAETFRILGVRPGTGGDLEAALMAMVDEADRAAVAAAMAAMRRTGQPLSIEFRVNRPDGAMRVLHARGEVVRDEGGAPQRMLGTIQDITQRRELEEQLNQSQKMEAVGQLAGGVAHDFNNLLTVITSYSGILLHDLPPADPNRADIKEIEDAALRAAGLTRQLLAFSRRQVLQPQLVDTKALIEQLEKLLRRLVREDIHIVTSLAADAGSVYADPGQLEQVLVNLVVNARDAMPAGGSLTISTRRGQYPSELTGSAEMEAVQGRCVVLEVTDTGTGMTPAVQARIFEPFFTTKGPTQGTGLGLSTVFGIVRQSGGDLEVHSTLGMGTTFRVYLPRRDGEATARASEEVRQQAPRTGGETILVVEDDEALRAVACRILRRQGYDVVEATDGRQALELCATRTPIHLVLTDMVMPGMGGHELGRQIAAVHPELAVIFMSGYTADTTAREGIAHDGSSYLQKPFTPATLAAKVREVLDGRSVRAAKGG